MAEGGKSGLLDEGLKTRPRLDLLSVKVRDLGFLCIYVIHDYIDFIYIYTLVLYAPLQ